MGTFSVGCAKELAQGPPGGIRIRIQEALKAQVSTFLSLQRPKKLGCNLPASIVREGGACPGLRKSKEGNSWKQRANPILTRALPAVLSHTHTLFCAAPQLSLGHPDPEDRQWKSCQVVPLCRNC